MWVVNVRQAPSHDLRFSEEVANESDGLAVLHSIAADETYNTDCYGILRLKEGEPVPGYFMTLYTDGEGVARYAIQLVTNIVNIELVDLPRSEAGRA